MEISPKNLTIAEGETGGATYTVVLDSEPTSAVTVTISGHAGNDLSTLDTTHAAPSPATDWARHRR